MTTKHNDEIIHKKLRSNTRAEFLRRWQIYALNAGQNNDDIRVRRVRSLLINQTYFNESSEGQESDLQLYIHISLFNPNIYFKCFKLSPGRFDYSSFHFQILITLCVKGPRYIKSHLQLYPALQSH
jgi:hypothetical protein